MKKQWKEIFASALMGAVLLTGCGGGEAKEEQNADAMNR